MVILFLFLVKGGKIVKKDLLIRKTCKVILLSSVVLFSSFGYNFTETYASTGSDTKFVNSNDIAITNDDYKRLTSLGFSYDQILSMTDVEYNLNKGISGSTISTSTEYIKVIEKNPQEENNVKASMQNSDSTINSNVQANVVEDTQTENNKKASISSDPQRIQK